MKTFLLKEKTPICKWGMIPPETYFFGEVPIGYKLACNPHDPYVILDIDKHGDIDGIKNIPTNIYDELFKMHFNYKTKNNGYHVWIKYSGDKTLRNKTSGLGLDLRTSKGYVVWYPKVDIRECIQLIKESSPELNNFLENLFA